LSKLPKHTFTHIDLSSKVVQRGVVQFGLAPIPGFHVSLESMPKLDNLFSINVRGMALCVKHAARAMVEGKVRGSIVCTSSVTGSHGGLKMTDYTMSKHATLGLMRSASIQLAKHGIRVNCVSPNGLATSMTCKLLDADPKEVELIFSKYSRLEGVVLNTKHVADAVLFLVSNESEFVTGLDLLVDGSYIAGKSELAF
jgi:NAD(P)-dependent dehydrogenase (short-subunit alcohol dehydrogenase family)